MITNIWAYVRLLWRFKRPLFANPSRITDAATAAAKQPDPRDSLKQLILLNERTQARIHRQLRRKRPVDDRLLIVTDAILTEVVRRTKARTDLPPDLRDVYPKDLRELRKMRYNRKAAANLAEELRC